MAFAGTGKIWMNGSMVDWKDATIHVASHVIHYGTGAFEGLRAYDSKTGTNVFRLEPHMRRMIDSCRVYRMEPKWSQQELSQAVLDTVRVNGFKSCYIRPVVFRGYDSLTLDPRPCPVEAAVIVWEWNQMMGVGSARARHRRRRQLVDAPGAEHAAGAGQGRRQLRELGVDQDAGDARRLRRRGGARRKRPVERRQRAEPVPRPRQRDLHAVARLVGAARHHPRHRHGAGEGSRLRVARDRRFRASSCIWRTRRSSAARPSRSRRSGPSTRSWSAAASAGRSPRRCSSGFSQFCAANTPIRMAG